MLRIVASLVAVPLVLVVLLAVALSLRDGSLGGLSTQLFELGPLPVVLLVGAVTLVIFLPLLLLAARFVKLSLLTLSAVGFLSSLLPVLVGAWSFLGNDRLRVGFRAQRFAEQYPWLVMGAVGGVLFWVFAIAGNQAVKHKLERPK
jgi:hypothetical protein